MKIISNTKLILFIILCFAGKAVVAQTGNWTEKQATQWVKSGKWRHGFKPQIYAGINNFEFARQYHQNQAFWDEAFAFLSHTNLDTLSVGKHVIDGDNVFATVSDGANKPFDQTAWESHRKYIDLQFVISGKERIGVANVATAAVTVPYDAAKDIAHYNAAPTFYIADPNTFFLFFPQDAHRPVIKVDGYDRVKKIVVKIRVADVKGDVADAFKFAGTQTDLMLKEIDTAKAQTTNPALVLPRTLDKNGNLVLISSKDWCSGFFPGELWYLYEFTGDSKWLKQAQNFTTYIAPEQFTTSTHDLGFEIYCSFGNGYRLTGDTTYKAVIIQAARSLITRFNPKVGAIKSWDNTRVGKYPVIIDNMMNLELLFEATRLSGDSSFYKVAVTHANTTLKNHFRADNSSYHVVNYDPETGQVINKITAQGYSNESAWARGQAWGLYGYTMCYRETKDKRYLQQAEKIADFILNNPELPADLIPYWDYNASDKASQSRDVSAAAVAASALYELSTYSDNGKIYSSTADKIISNLTAYHAQPGGNKGFLLLHSTGSKPGNSEINVPLIYADYYYLEALTRKQRLDDHQAVVR